MTEPRIAYSLKEVAKLMGVPYTTAIDMAARGEIELIPTQGRRLLVPARWVDQLRSNTGPTAA